MGKIKRYIINKDVETKKNGRTAPKISVETFKEKIKEFSYSTLKKFDMEYDDKESHLKGNLMNALRTLYFQHFHKHNSSQIGTDFKGIRVDWENHDIINDIRTTNGIPYYLCYAAGDWEAPVYFIVYYDGKKIRVYVPHKGNTWRSDTKQALGNLTMPDYAKKYNTVTDDEYVFKMLIKQGDIEKDEFEKVPAGIANKVEADKDAIIKDFSEHVQAKGSLKESSLTPEEQQRYNKIINEVARYVKSEIEKL